MAQAAVYNSVPRTILNGINDGSLVPQVAAPEAIPIHLPFFYIQSPDGPTTDALLLGSGDTTRIYGVNTTNKRMQYFNHVTALLVEMEKLGNAVMVKRLVRPSFPINVSSVSPNTQYAIYSLGTTTNAQWQAAGFIGTPQVGALFTTGIGVTNIPGTGQVTANNPAIAKATLGVVIDNITPTFQYARNINGTVITTANGSNQYTFAATNVAIGSFLANTSYQIVSLGNTTTANWNAVGVAGTPQVGSIFTTPSSNFAGVATIGGGTVNQLVPITGGITLTFVSLPYSGNYVDGASVSYNGQTVWPLLSFADAFYGADGNNTGVKIWAAVPNTNYAEDTDIVNDQSSLLFNAQIIYKPSNSTLQTVADVNGLTYCTFSFKPNAYNYKSNANLPITQIVKNWSDDGKATNSSPTFSPIGSVNVFNNNLASLLNQLLVAENANAPTPISSIYLLNFLTGVDQNGVPNYGFQINQNGLIVNQNNTIYLTGGNDGDLSAATFEAAVVNEIVNNYKAEGCNLLDTAKYPFSSLYDTGFTNNLYNGYSVKTALALWTTYRKDVNVTIGTHYIDGTNVQLNAAAEVSSVNSLISSIALYSESILWGTPPVRMVLMTQSGYLTDNSWDTPVSLVFDLAMKRASAWGASAGAFKPSMQYQVYPGNTITSLKEISNPSFQDVTKAALFTAGANYCQYYDRNTLFYPTLQTIYSSAGVLYESSVLTSEDYMVVCTDVEKKIEITWRRMVGNNNLTESQFAKKSNDIFNNLTGGIYPAGITLSPNTYFTAADSVRGYSWVMDVTVGGQVPKTVGASNIIGVRAVPTSTTIL